MRHEENKCEVAITYLHSKNCKTLYDCPQIPLFSKIGSRPEKLKDTEEKGILQDYQKSLIKDNEKSTKLSRATVSKNREKKFEL